MPPRSKGLRLARLQQKDMAARACHEYASKNLMQDIPDFVLHVLNLMVDKHALKDVPSTVKKIEIMVSRHDKLETKVADIVKKMEAEDAKELAKAKKNESANTDKPTRKRKSNS